MFSYLRDPNDTILVPLLLGTSPYKILQDIADIILCLLGFDRDAFAALLASMMSAM